MDGAISHRLKKLLRDENLILMNVPEYPTDKYTEDWWHYWGGEAIVVKNIAERLAHKGYEPLVTPRLKDYSRGVYFDSKNGVHILSLPINYELPWNELGYAGREYKWLYDMNVESWEIRKKMLDHSATVWHFLKNYEMDNSVPVHVHDFHEVLSILKARDYGIQKRVFTVHGSFKRDKDYGDARTIFEKIAGENASKIHYISNSQKESCEVHGWPKEKQVVIPNGVDIVKYVPPEKENTEYLSTLEKYRIEEGYVYWCGRLVPEKNVPRLIKAWSKSSIANECGLLIAGLDGNDGQNVLNVYNSLPQKLKEKVRIMVGPLPEKERIHLYQGSSICCFPSLKEAFGLVSVEAQGCGKPVVVSRDTGLEETILPKRSGWLVNPYLEESITIGLENTYYMRGKMGKDTRKNAETFFDWDKIVTDYIEELYSG